MSDVRRRQAYAAGCKAALAGKPKTPNEHERGTIFYDDWSDGWEAGNRGKSTSVLDSSREE